MQWSVPSASVPLAQPTAFLGTNPAQTVQRADFLGVPAAVAVHRLAFLGGARAQACERWYTGRIFSARERR